MLSSLRYEVLCRSAVTPMKDEAELLAGARRLDSRALAAIHDRYYPDLYRYVQYRTNDSGVAEDISSEVFMRLLDGLHAGRPPRSLRAWLFGVANHMVADHFRRAARRVEVALPENLPAGQDHDPEAAAGESQRLQDVRHALTQLTEDQQEVLALRFGEGRSLEQTAAELDKSVNAVKQLQFRAVAALRRRLEGSV